MTDLLKEVSEIGLSWPISVIHNADLITCTCESRRGPGHKIAIDRYTLEDPAGRYFLPLHELAHCRLAEDIDPCFAGIQFGYQASQEECNMVYLAWAAIDVWVNQVRHKYWQSAIADEQKINFLEMSQLAKAQPGLIKEEPTLFIGLALFRVEGRYYGIDHDTRDILRRANCHEIRDYERILWEMANTEPSVEALQEYVRRFARFFQFDINPTYTWSDEFQMYIVTR